ncbi:ParB N-terminal domain-containing protein [Streptomyces sp. PU-14G]|uniref:ParB N-terminal domain-containing protein n=1 Tax=Streptomyces sp. PU-14G TaxID=2800808 RepID=UPI0034DE2CAC
MDCRTSVERRPDEPGGGQWPHTPRDGESTVDVPVAALCPADSPRAGGEDAAHTRALAETEATLPPLLVHRATMRVIDGMHRLRAAELRGDATVPVRFFDGDEAAAFVLAVRSNIAHGLPLTLADRKAAALRIVTSHPQWSDRMIADATGLAHKTVGAIRRRHGGEAQPAGRVGRDGRTRPVNSGERRLRASELLEQDPHATSEEIGRAAGVSPTTVKEVRRRLRQGEDPLPAARPGWDVHDPGEHVTPGARPQAPSRPRPPSVAPHDAPRQYLPTAAAPVPDRAADIQRLCADPSLRLTECGRALLRWLSAGPRTAEEVAALASRMPAHHLGLIAGLARQSACLWQQFSDEVERRADPRATAGN